MGELAYDYKFYEEPYYEIIEGEKFSMAAARPFLKHITISNRLFSIFENYIFNNNLDAAAFVECDVHLPDGNNTFIPDFCVVCNFSAAARDNAIYGAPDLVVEVLSRSTMKKDIGIKKSIYERNCVKEYWIISPWAESIEVYHLVDGKFELDNVYQIFTEEEFNNLEESERAEVKFDIPVSIFDNLVIDVHRIFKWWN